MREKMQHFRISGVIWVRDGVLVLVGIEAIFFIVASKELCFGFMLETVDNRRMLLLLLTSAHIAPRPLLLLSCFSPYSTSGEAGGAQGLGRGVVV